MSVEIFTRFTNETFTDDLNDSSSAAFLNLQSKVKRNVSIVPLGVIQFPFEYF